MGADQPGDRERTMSITAVLKLTSLAAGLATAMCLVNLARKVHAETVPMHEARTASVRIVPVYVVNGDELGNDLHVDLFQSRGDKADFARSFHRGEATEIPYGTYTTRIHVRGFPSVERIVQVGQPNVVVVVGFQIAVEGRIQASDYSGHIRGVNPAVGSVRVRLAGVYSNDVLDAEAKAGEFFFGSVPHGEYVLAVTQKGRILATNAVSIPSQSRIEIEIGGKKSIASK